MYSCSGGGDDGGDGGDDDGGDAGRSCVEAGESKTANLSCSSGRVIKSIDFASYGVPKGSCADGYATGTCHASTSKSKVQSECLGRQSCAVGANNAMFGDPCPGTPKKLSVVYTCSDEIDDPPDPGKVMPVFLLSGQSNMEGNVERSLYDDLVYELETGSEETRQRRLEDRLTAWYRNYNGGYAMYGYSPQMVSREASELVRLKRAGLVSSSLSKPYSQVYCTSSDTPTPQPLAFNCGHPYGPELMMGHVLGKTAYAPTSLIKVAKGGTLLDTDWLPPSAARRTGRSVGSYYGQLSQKIRSLRSNPGSIHPNCAKQQCRWAGFVWFQGENDSIEQASAQAYQKNLEDLIADVRSEIGDPRLPVIIVGMGRWPQEELSYGMTVFSAQQAVVNADPSAKLVRTEDLSGYYHFDPAAQLIIGERIGNALTAMLK